MPGVAVFCAHKRFFESCHFSWNRGGLSETEGNSAHPSEKKAPNQIVIVCSGYFFFLCVRVMTTFNELHVSYLHGVSSKVSPFLCPHAVKSGCITRPSHTRCSSSLQLYTLHPSNVFHSVKNSANHIPFFKKKKKKKILLDLASHIW